MRMKMVVTMMMLMMDRCEQNGLYERWRSTEEVDGVYSCENRGKGTLIVILLDVKRGDLEKMDMCQKENLL